MTLNCGHGHNQIVTATLMGLREMRCTVCGRISEIKNESKKKGNIGIHPALARRYQEIETIVPRQSVLHPAFLDAKDHLEEKLPEIPGYEILECIGQGAMGKVYFSRHLRSNSDTAIKVLSKEFLARPELVARFQREVAALKTLRHPNVVAILDNGIHKDLHYFSMEFVRGITLRRCLMNGALASDIAVKYVYSLLQGLSAMHSRGIVHRDVKPENILLQFDHSSTLITGQERVVLVDFGLAGIGEDGDDPHPNLTKSRVTMGTVNYMAPEQHMDAKRVDHRTDLYACGVILYECLTGDLPLGRFALPSEKGVSAPLLVDACITRALALNREQRFQSAAEFCEMLKSILLELVPGKSIEPSRKAKVANVIGLGSRYLPKDSSKVRTTIHKKKLVEKKPLIVGVLAIALGFLLGLIYFHG